MKTAATKIKNLFKFSPKLSAENLKDTNSVVSEDLNETASIASLTTENPNSTHKEKPNIRKNLNKVISVLADRPELFSSILDITKNPKFLEITNSGLQITEDSALYEKMAIALKVFNLPETKKLLPLLEGTRAELISLGFSIKKGGIPALLRNGLLEELASLEPKKVKLILDQVFDHEFIETQKKELSLNIPNETLKFNIMLLINLANTLQNTGINKELGNEIAILVENNNKIKELEKKLTKTENNNKEKLNKEIKHIKDSYLDNISNIRGHLTTALSLKKSQTATFDLIKALAPTITTAIDGLPKSSLLNNTKDTVLSELKLKKDVKLADLYDLSIPIIDKIEKHPENLAKIIKATDIFEDNPAILIKETIELLKHNDILLATADPKKLKQFNASLKSNLEETAKKTIEILSKDNVLETIMGVDGLKSLAPKILDLPKVQEFLKIKNPQVAKEFSKIAPSVIDYVQHITQAALKHPEAIQLLAKDMQAYNSANLASKPKQLINLISSATELVQKTKIADALLNEESLNKIFTEVGKTTLLQKYLKDDLTYLTQALKLSAPILVTAFKDTKESKELESLFVKLNSPMDRNKAKHLAIEFIDTLKTNPQAINSAISSNEKTLAQIIDNSLSSVKKESRMLKLLKPLGINGEFMLSMLQKVNNPEGLSAIQKCIKEPSLINGIKVLSTSKSTIFILGHMTKSGLNNTFGAKTKEIQSWASKTFNRVSTQSMSR
jgi:hypothetical protein